MAITGKEAWEKVEDLLGDEEISLGQQWSFNLRNDPKRLAFVLSRYKFAAKMAGPGKEILELGCGEGVGAPILAERATRYVGVDYDREAIQAAAANWSSPLVSFREADILDSFQIGIFDMVVSFDVIEHIRQEYEARFFQTILAHLKPDGVALVGTPNVTAQPYASAMSVKGHINNFTQERLHHAMASRFEVVFMFGGNDEVIHTGFAPMSHFLIAMGCGKKESTP
ncbi:MAG: class I SAM-dependent methyltransferase [Chitinivibrionia bacterium]|nr:class I SAM-dependent methyltransferase [Chitinivibrionia bacterium]